MNVIGSSSTEIIHYLNSCRFAEEDEAFLKSLTLDSLLPLPWTDQLRAIVLLPSNDIRMVTLLPHIAEIVEQLHCDERDLALLEDDAWRKNVLIEDWVQSRQIIIARHGNTSNSTKNQKRLLFRIIHGIDEILGEPSVDYKAPTGNSIYNKAAKRQLEVLQRWKEAATKRSHGRVANILSQDTECSLISLFQNVGDMDCEELNNLRGNMDIVAVGELQMAGRTIMTCCHGDDGDASFTTRKGRARLLALVYWVMVNRTGDRPALQWGDENLCVVLIGLLFLAQASLDPLKCSIMIQEVIKRSDFLNNRRNFNAVRKGLLSCGHTEESAEMSLMVLQERNIGKSQPKVTYASSKVYKKRHRESAATVVDKLYGGENKVRKKDNLEEDRLRPLGDKETVTTSSGDDEDYESDDCILLL